MERKENISNKTKELTITAVLIALSAVGAVIKIYNTVAFDSMPGYFAALYLSGWQGALVIGLGHILTAVTSGFPFGIPIHLLIALMMAICAFVFRIAYKKYNIYISIIVTTVLNGPIFALAFVPIFGWGFFLGMVAPLTIASLSNVVLATMIYKAITRMGK